MRVYIPSQGRASQLTRKKMTTDYIMEATFVVPRNEEQAYTRALDQVAKRKRDGSAYRVEPCPEQGIANVRHWIGRHAAQDNMKNFLMIDDDLTFFTRKSVTDFHLRDITPTEVGDMLAWTARQFDQGTAHVSISVRQGNNQGPLGGPADATRRNTRTLRYLAYATEPFLAMKHGRVLVMEDFDVNLQLLRAGYDNVVSFYWCQNQAATGMPGGCSSYRSLAAHNAAAEKLAELHKPFVKLREKENKTGPAEMRNRREVTIYWQKARGSAE